jgi:small conductance mechanosensitive channel
MNQELLFELDSFVRLYLVPTAWKVTGALAIWIIGGWAIKLIRVAFVRFMRLRQVDETIARYLDASAAVVLKLLTLIAVLGVLGIETTSFAALLAAVGLAIGAAWSGLLANFAAGLFLLSFRPFKVGDSISAAGTAGTVREIGLFMTTIDTPDHVLTYVPNNKLFMDNVQNFSANPTRRVDLTAQAPMSTDVEDTVNRLASVVKQIPNVLAQPAPRVEILTFSATGPVLTVRPYCRNEHYWQVYFDTNRAINQVCIAGAGH